MSEQAENSSSAVQLRVIEARNLAMTAELVIGLKDTVCELATSWSDPVRRSDFIGKYGQRITEQVILRALLFSAAFVQSPGSVDLAAGTNHDAR